MNTAVMLKRLAVIDVTALDALSNRQHKANSTRSTEKGENTRVG
jgi:hypothetical protein